MSEEHRIKINRTKTYLEISFNGKSRKDREIRGDGRVASGLRESLVAANRRLSVDWGRAFLRV